MLVVVELVLLLDSWVILQDDWVLVLLVVKRSVAGAFGLVCRYQESLLLVSLLIVGMVAVVIIVLGSSGPRCCFCC